MFAGRVAQTSDFAGRRGFLCGSSAAHKRACPDFAKQNETAVKSNVSTRRYLRPYQPNIQNQNTPDGVSNFKVRSSALTK